MNDQNLPQTDCEETSCKDDLFAGLLSIFAQADAQDAQSEDASDDN